MAGLMSTVGPSVLQKIASLMNGPQGGAGAMPGGGPQGTGAFPVGTPAGTGGGGSGNTPITPEAIGGVLSKPNSGKQNAQAMGQKFATPKDMSEYNGLPNLLGMVAGMNNSVRPNTYQPDPERTLGGQQGAYLQSLLF